MFKNMVRHSHSYSAQPAHWLLAAGRWSLESD
jgi:hypothetical protein